jgi:hypothetical protein
MARDQSKPYAATLSGNTGPDGVRELGMSTMLTSCVGSNEVDLVGNTAETSIEKLGSVPEIRRSE